MKSALVCFNDTLAGRLSETDEGFVFQYDTDYLSSAEAQPISLYLQATDGWISRVAGKRGFDNASCRDRRYKYRQAFADSSG